MLNSPGGLSDPPVNASKAPTDKSAPHELSLALSHITASLQTRTQVRICTARTSIRHQRSDGIALAIIVLPAPHVGDRDGLPAVRVVCEGGLL